MSLYRLLANLLVLLLLGCGGGGGSDIPPEVPKYTLSGEIKTLSAIVFDHDVNDPDAAYQSNDDFSRAQFLPSPFNLGGYLNLAREGEAGRSFSEGDAHDFYRLRLIRDQVITLQTIEPDKGHLALRLYTVDEPPRQVAAITGTRASKTLIARATGEFYLQVEALQGASAYTLTTGLSQISGRESRSQDFIPGEILVKFQTTGKSATHHATFESLGLKIEQRLGGDVALLTWLDDSGKNVATKHLRQRTLEIVDVLQATPGIRYAEPNYRVKPYQVPSDPLYYLQWNFPMVNLPAAWNLETGSNTVVVAVIDTGILPGHPDLQANLLPGYDFITNLQRAADGDGADSDPSDPGALDNPEKSAAYHGTHVAGVIAATTGNGAGVAGAAWGIKVMPLRALGALDGSVADVADAIYYAAGLENRTGQLPNQRADIINLSLGTTDFSQVLADAVTAASNAGVIILAAAGNDSTAAQHYPAALAEVISVAAVDSSGLRAAYSNIGSTIDLAAPGGDDADNNGDGLADSILSTLGDSTGKRSYELLQGTSMACAHVSAIVGLMESIYQRNNSDLTPAGLENFLLQGSLSQEKGASGWDEIYGYGLIDAYKSVATAIKAVTNSEPPALPPQLSVSPASLNFGTAETEAEIMLSNQGGDSPGFAVVTASSDQDWLQVLKIDEPANEQTEAGLGRYRIIADRQHPQLQGDDLYQATISFTSNEPSQAANTDLDVYLQVSSVVDTPNAGSQHVNLIDLNTGHVFQTLIVNPVNGSYPFEFKDVPGGRYQITSHTDADNDKQACESGETCGSYPTLSGAYQIEVGADLSDLNFTTSLSLDLR